MKKEINISFVKVIRSQKILFETIFESICLEKVWSKFQSDTEKNHFQIKAFHYSLSN